MHKVVVLAAVHLGFLAACGGGGYGSGGGGGGGGGGGQTIAPPGMPNVETLQVNGGPAGVVNTAFISLQVCVHGSTTNCKTIDGIEVDTGSVGLRILASALSAAPAITLGTKTDGINPLSECFEFADGTTYGSLAVADITLPVSGETASNVVVQVIGDPAYVPAHIPADCGPGTTQENDLAHFGANGILGVGPFIYDCTSTGSCPVPTPGITQGVIYYTCPSPSTCADAAAPQSEQAVNPVSLFMTDNNGVIIELPAVGSAGAASITGSLVFGIGTRTNNGLGSATVLPSDPASGFVTATYKGKAFADGFIDSGSNGNFFNDSSLKACPSPNQAFYCPGPTVAEMVTLKGTSATTLTVNFNVVDAVSMFSAYPNNNLYPDLAGTNPDANGFGFGLPFHYGRNVFTAIENANTPGGVGPYFAF